MAQPSLLGRLAFPFDTPGRPGVERGALNGVELSASLCAGGPSNLSLHESGKIGVFELPVLRVVFFTAPTLLRVRPDFERGAAHKLSLSGAIWYVLRWLRPSWSMVVGPYTSQSAVVTSNRCPSESSALTLCGPLRLLLSSLHCRPLGMNLAFTSGPWQARLKTHSSNISMTRVP